MRRAITIKEARELSLQIMKDAEQRRIDSAEREADEHCRIIQEIRDEPGPIQVDTWTSGKILPLPDHDRIMADTYLAIRKDSESVTIETYWFDDTFGGGWKDDADLPIEVSAWRRIPMDGIDEAVRLGDLA